MTNIKSTPFLYHAFPVETSPLSLPCRWSQVGSGFFHWFCAFNGAWVILHFKLDKINKWALHPFVFLHYIYGTCRRSSLYNNVFLIGKNQSYFPHQNSRPSRLPPRSYIFLWIPDWSRFPAEPVQAELSVICRGLCTRCSDPGIPRVNHRNLSTNLHVFSLVVRIRNVYPGSEFFPSRIQGKKGPGSGSATKNCN